MWMRGPLGPGCHETPSLAKLSAALFVHCMIRARRLVVGAVEEVQGWIRPQGTRFRGSTRILDGPDYIPRRRLLRSCDGKGSVGPVGAVFEHNAGRFVGFEYYPRYPRVLVCLSGSVGGIVVQPAREYRRHVYHHDLIQPSGQREEAIARKSLVRL